jgi:predicted DNA-binding transcriptional regulator AlpA
MSELKIYTAKDVGKLLSLNVSTIYRLHKLGRMPKPFSVGKKLLWREPDLRAFLGFPQDDGIPEDSIPEDDATEDN